MAKLEKKEDVMVDGSTFGSWRKKKKKSKVMNTGSIEPTLNYYKYRFHRTHLHDFLTHSTHDNNLVPPSLSFAHTSIITTYTCFTLLIDILT